MVVNPKSEKNEGKYSIKSFLHLLSCQLIWKTNIMNTSAITIYVSFLLHSHVSTENEEASFKVLGDSTW